MESVKALLAATCVGMGAPLAGTAVAAADPVEAYFEGDLPLEGGGVIQDFSISYATYGRLNAQRSNAILMATAIGANHHRLDYLLGPGKALDTDRYFIITTNAIGNGSTTSPSNSVKQPGMSFPRFTIRDMVESQHRLITRKLGIKHLHAVVGASMGGMQTLQWGVSHPEMMGALVAIVPLGRTPPWTAAVLELTRREIMSDPAWANGSYSQSPENGMRLWAQTMALITRTPELLKHDIPNSSDTAGWLQTVSDDAWKKVDARNWMYQSWAYETHDVGATPGFDGDYLKALRAIRARTLILAGTKDLLNPESEAVELANDIPNARLVSIQPRMPVGHFAAAGKTPPEVDLQNTAIGLFLSQGDSAPPETKHFSVTEDR